MKLIKAIKLHWKFRIRQEYACNKACEFTQIIPRPGGEIPFLSELSSLNKAVHNVEKHIPNIYFILSDLFGGARLLKKQCKLYYIRKEAEEIERWKELFEQHKFCFDLVTAPSTPTILYLRCSECKSTDIDTRETLRRTNGPRHPFKRISYGYKLEIHTCKKCLHIWDGKKLQL